MKQERRSNAHECSYLKKEAKFRMQFSYKYGRCEVDVKDFDSLIARICSYSIQRLGMCAMGIRSILLSGRWSHVRIICKLLEEYFAELVNSELTTRASTVVYSETLSRIYPRKQIRIDEIRLKDVQSCDVKVSSIRSRERNETFVDSQLATSGFPLYFIGSFFSDKQSQPLFLAFTRVEVKWNKISFFVYL